jgi:hypothetical protein
MPRYDINVNKIKTIEIINDAFSLVKYKSEHRKDFFGGYGGVVGVHGKFQSQQ